MSNRLAHTTSPYLQQHAENPVDWYPWGEEALNKAKQEDKPILLSIGYSACHWCHVMAHESFEQAQTAALMNEKFINIKVDREERPDLDKIYQHAHQLLSKRGGGWPLTIFLTPKTQQPFFSGTYFPPKKRHGLPAFEELLTAVAEAYADRREMLEQQSQQIVDALSQQTHTTDGKTVQEPDVQLLKTVIAEIASGFDEEDGGFGKPPKFPHPETLDLLLLQARLAGDERALIMAEHTLTRMALGGIYDQVGGGFCRYSVDKRWMIPHFEKMLYDNGPLLACYSDLWSMTRNPLFADTAKGIANWVIAEMQSPEGGYYSSLDADSEGKEGLFYLWTPQQVKSLMGEDAEESWQAFSSAYALDQAANFEGRWNLHRLDQDDAATTGNSFPEIRAMLLRERGKRIRPGCDEKQLTSWNALMILGMARCASVFSEKSYMDSADRALAFIKQHLWVNGRLQAVYKDGRCDFNAYLDDYVYLLDALWEMLQLRWRNEDLAWAVALIEVVIEHFSDPYGGFFFTSDDHESLIQRPKPLMDDAMPAGNGVAVRVLAKFGYLLGEERYLDAAERTLKSCWNEVVSYPHAHCSLLQGLSALHQPQPIIIVRADNAELSMLQVMTRNKISRDAALFLIADQQSELVPAIATKKPHADPVWYLCQGNSCSIPMHGIDEMLRMMDEQSEKVEPTKTQKNYFESR